MKSPSTWRSFLLSCTFGLALFAIANYAVFSTHPYFQRERDYWTKVNGYFSGRGAEVLFAGDSHVAQLDNAFLSDHAYNVAWGGDGLREIYAKLRYLLYRGAPVKTLILTADIHMFGDGRLHSSNRSFVDPYLLWTRSPYGYERNPLSAAMGTIPLFNDDFVQYLRKQVFDSRTHGRAVGAEEESAAWASLTGSERAQISEKTGAMDHRGVGSHSEPFEWYARIISLAQAHHIQIIGVMYPADPGYLKFVPADQSSSINRRLISMGVDRILDFRHEYPGPEYFKDPDHLNRKGAIALLQSLQQATGLRLLNEDAAEVAAKSYPPSVTPRP